MLDRILKFLIGDTA